MEKNTWYTIKNQSLAVYTREAGFDLAIYDEYSSGTQTELRKRTINTAIYWIQDAFEAQNVPLKTIKRGIYVISLSDPFTINYRIKNSQILYIGIGNIIGRIKSHFETSLFDLMQSLSGTNFDFYFAYPARQNKTDYYKHVEWEMLEHFKNKVGGMDTKRCFPLLNRNAGSNRGVDDDGKWWVKPLKSSGKRPKWALHPTAHSEFAPLD